MKFLFSSILFIFLSCSLFAQDELPEPPEQVLHNHIRERLESFYAMINKCEFKDELQYGYLKGQFQAYRDMEIVIYRLFHPELMQSELVD